MVRNGAMGCDQEWQVVAWNSMVWRAMVGCGAVLRGLVRWSVARLGLLRSGMASTAEFRRDMDGCVEVRFGKPCSGLAGYGTGRKAGAVRHGKHVHGKQ